jgi:3-dehydroshikimate dehydratase
MTSPTGPFSTGMCSVTLRQLPVPAVLEVLTAAGLACIEWGADVHVPPGDLRGAARTRELGLDAGVRVSSYGSYFRCGTEDFTPVLATAVALGAPRIRIWAGDTGSADTGPERRREVAAVARAAARQAADAGVQLAFEYHGGTLTDTAESTLRLLEDVDHPSVGTYWQPPVGRGDTEALEDLGHVLDRVAAVHVFSWWPLDQRHPLRAREPFWRDVFAVLACTGRPYDALLEFVPDDDPAQVANDAATLARLIGAAA